MKSTRLYLLFSLVFATLCLCAGSPDTLNAAEQPQTANKMELNMKKIPQTHPRLFL